ncbi:hypothetical protein NADFUDRAFT_83521 [Nadsonia fulvescens var. elongata DSM 6958]|uniref:BAG domain-containing protein n=1 Tax=Nadsonia fulvescens var. elongata DSM 6958 TaxID=857566 RepID=A0A1E3PGX1_9ASCO|nr:hypothetical protein NADFUDRAFT_83521 [Nadsonia fulvescens var. elongata DSM 6958]
MFRKLASNLGFSKEFTPLPTPPKSIIISYGKNAFNLAFDAEDSKDEKRPERGPTVGFVRKKVLEIVESLEQGKQASDKKSENATQEKDHPIDKKSDSSRVILVHRGRKLTDDDSPLADRGVETGDKILVLLAKIGAYNQPGISLKELKSRQKYLEKQEIIRAEKSRTAALGPRDKIQKILDDFERDIKPLYTTYLTEVTKQKEAEVPNLDIIKEQHKVLEELILQRLFKFDEIDTMGDPEIRKFRKDSINEVQEYHNNIDRLMNELKAKTKL